MSLPEIDGAIEPIIYAGREGATGRSVPLPDRINILAERALKWANLGRKENKDKKLAVTVFQFPPDKGNVGTAAYLDVFGSIHAVLKELAKQGYDVGTIPETPMELVDIILQDKEAKFDSPTLNIAYRMSVDEYEGRPGTTRIWRRTGTRAGPPQHGRHDLLVYGATFGNVFIGVQPMFGYEGDPMRLLFSKSEPPPRLRGVLHVPRGDLQGRRRAPLRDARFARVHAGQAGRHVGRVLPGPLDPQHPEPLLLRGQQPL